MKSRCTICNHPQLPDINLAILSGNYTLEALHEKFGLGTSSLQRHKNHLREKMFQARDRFEDGQKQILMLKLNNFLDQVERGVETASANGDLDRVFKGAHLGGRLIYQINNLKVPLDLETVYRLISSPEFAAQASLLPTDAQTIIGLHQAVADCAFSPCPDPPPEPQTHFSDHRPLTPDHCSSDLDDDVDAFLTSAAAVLAADHSPETRNPEPETHNDDAWDHDPDLDDDWDPDLDDDWDPDLEDDWDLDLDKEVAAFLTPPDNDELPDLLPETRNPELETKNPLPATRNPKPETHNSEPASLSLFQQLCRKLNLAAPDRHMAAKQAKNNRKISEKLPANPPSSNDKTMQYQPDTLCEKNYPKTSAVERESEAPPAFGETKIPPAAPAAPPPPDSLETHNPEPETKNPPPQNAPRPAGLCIPSRTADELFEISHGYKRNNPPKHIPDRRRDEDFRTGTIFGDVKKILKYF